MSTTSWKAGLSGDWFTAAYWDNGVPTSATDVTIDAFGTYTVTLSGAGAANSLTLDSAGATLSESASGSLAVTGTFEIDAGTAILNGSNAFSSFLVTGAHSTAIVDGVNTISSGTVITNFATLDLGNAGGLGSASFELFQGQLRATATETINNALVIDRQGTISAAAGKTLTLNNGNWWIQNTTTDIQFGTDSDTGTIVWRTASPLGDDGHDILVQGGTLKGGDANFGTLFTNAFETTVNAGAKLDLAGADATINDLQGTGIVTSSTGAPILTLTTDFTTQSGNDQETVGNLLTGHLSLDLVGNGSFSTYIFTANNTYTGTTTVEATAELNIGNGGTSGTLGKGTVDLINGVLEFDRSDVLTVTNTIIGSGGVDYLAGTYLVKGSNTYSGGTQILDNALVEASIASAIGSGRLLVSDGAEFLATANMTLTNALHFGVGGDTETIAAAHGHILTLSAASDWDVDNRTGIVIGDGTDDGTVLWKAGGAGTFEDSNATLEIGSGTLKDGDGTLYEYLQGFASVTVDAGATLSGAPFLSHVQGQGSIVLGGGATLDLSASDFAGTIAAKTLDIGGGGAVVLTGDSAGVGDVIIDGTLVLGDGGTTGSLGAARIEIALGTLIIDHGNDVALTGMITGDHVFSTLELLGTGTTTIDRTNAFGDTVDLVAGELSIDRNAAIGNGTLKVEGGEFLVTGNVTMASSALNITGDVTFAAAAGKVLTLEATSWSFDADSITFGDGTNTGKIVWHTPGSGSGVAPGDHFTVDVAAGTTLVSDGNMGQILFVADSTTIESGATLNIGTQGVSVGNLLGSGTIMGTGGNLDVKDGEFAGVIRGSSNVEVSGDFEVSAMNTFTGDYNLGTGATLTLDNAASQDVFFFGDATVAFALGHLYTGTVFNFDLNVGQTMDFEGFSFATATEHFHNGVLTVTDGTHVRHVALDGAFSDASFVLSDDHHGGTNVNFTGTFVDGGGIG